MDDLSTFSGNSGAPRRAFAPKNQWRGALPTWRHSDETGAMLFPPVMNAPLNNYKDQKSLPSLPFTSIYQVNLRVNPRMSKGKFFFLCLAGLRYPGKKADDFFWATLRCLNMALENDHVQKKVHLQAINEAWFPWQEITNELSSIMDSGLYYGYVYIYIYML